MRRAWGEAHAHVDTSVATMERRLSWGALRAVPPAAGGSNFALLGPGLRKNVAVDLVAWASPGRGIRNSLVSSAGVLGVSKCALASDILGPDGVTPSSGRLLTPGAVASTRCSTGVMPKRPKCDSVSTRVFPNSLTRLADAEEAGACPEVIAAIAVEMAANNRLKSAYAKTMASLWPIASKTASNISREPSSLRMVVGRPRSSRTFESRRQARTISIRVSLPSRFPSMRSKAFAQRPSSVPLSCLTVSGAASSSSLIMRTYRLR
jgi:hypothetical protein